MNKRKKETWWVVDESDNLQLECGTKKEAQKEASARRKEIKHDLLVRIKNLKKDIYINCRNESELNYKE